MTLEKPILDVERQGDTLVLVPAQDLRELECDRVEGAAGDVLGLLQDPSIRNIVIDFHRTDYFGSTALSFFLMVWKTIRQRQGTLALCNVSAHENEILDVAGLHFWPICASRAEALAAVQAGGRRP
jgi:anti-anti-sigma factor